MKQIDMYSVDLMSLYREITQKQDEFVYVFHGINSNQTELQDPTIKTMLEKFKKSKSKKITFYPTDYSIVKYSKIIPYEIDVHLSKKKTANSGDRIGVFKLEFNTGEVLLIGRWLEGYGRHMMVRTICVGPYGVYLKYLTCFVNETRKNCKPKSGIFRGFSDQFGNVVYQDLKKLPTSPVIHPIVEQVEKEIKYYFNNVNVFTRFKQSGIRKLMLISEPGTGKSSLFYKIARENKDKCVVFFTDIGSAAHHIRICSKYNKSTIVILEDADSYLSHTDSSVLNFLDGVDTPTNSSGTLILMSTNFPDNIEPRILSRPGRIDKIYHIEALRDGWAYECALLYFAEFFNCKKNKAALTDIVTGMTGAQIKELALASMSYAASVEKSIDIDIIKIVKDSLEKQLSEAYRYAEKNSINNFKNNKKSVGFNLKHSQELTPTSIPDSIFNN